MNKKILTILILFLINIVIFSYHSFIYFSFSPPEGVISMGDNYGATRIVANYFESYLALFLAILSTLVLLIHLRYKAIHHLIWIILISLYIVFLMMDIVIIKGFMLTYSLPVILYIVYQVIQSIITRPTN